MSQITKEKSKDALMHPLGLTVLALLLQVIALVAGYVMLKPHIGYVSIVLHVLAFLLVIYLINGQKNPAYQIAWVVILVAMPIFGVLLFLMIQLIPGTRAVAGRLKRQISKTSIYLPQNNHALEKLRQKNAHFASLSDYLYKQGPFPVYEHTKSCYYPLGDDVFPAMLEDMRAAKDYIFMEYFIVAEGRLWDDVFAVLKEKAAQGVEVRFMYDGTNMFRLPKDFNVRLEEAGINCRIFAPVRPFFSTYQNNRNHRKILVIDGKVAYTGGINLADEYINAVEKFGHWKDTAIRIEGDAVQTMTALFLQNFHVHQDEDAEYARYLSPGAPKAEAEHSFVIPYADMPGDDVALAEEVYIHVLYNATRYVHMTTPYLILDYETQKALIFAARRGVDVTLLLPHIPDKKIPFFVARSYYSILIANGVNIVEYTPGFCHAKVLVADDTITSVGTVNLDYRSLYLHFENGILLYDEHFAHEVEADFQKTIAKGRKVTLADYRAFPWYERALGRIMRIFGPLM